MRDHGAGCAAISRGAASRTARRRTISALFAAAAVYAAPALSHAQAVAPGAATPSTDQRPTAKGAGPSGPADVIGEVVVTARKSTETLQKTPAAVQVVGSAQLVDRGVTDIVRLTSLTTGVIFQTNRENVLVFSRGLGQSDGQPQTTPSVEIELDGYNVPKLALQTALFDLADVQILKGPQGILYGRNAIGGAVLIDTKRPSLKGFSETGSIEFGNYSLVHGTVAANMPLGSDFALRAAVDYNKHDGYFTTGGNDLDSLSARLGALANPTDRLSVFASLTYSRRNGKGFPNVSIPAAPEANGNPWYVAPVPTSGTVNNVNFNDVRNRGFFKAESYALNSEVKYKLTDDLLFTYVGGYLTYSSAQVNAYQNRPLGKFVSNSTMYFNETFTDYSNETRLSYNRGRTNVIVGLLQHRFDLPALLVDASYEAPPILSGPLHTTENNYAVFGDARIGLLDKLRLEVGLRQSWDTKGASGRLFGDAINLNGSNFPTFENLSYKVGLEYDPRPGLLVYGNFQTGYLPGAYQTVPAATLAALGRPRRYLEETLDAYTAGFKTRFFSDRLQLNAEGFYYDYSNFQVNQRVELIVGGASTFQTPYANIKKSRIYGADIDLTARVVTGGRATIGLSLLNASIVDSGFTSLAVLQPTGFFANIANPSLSGYQLPNSPDVTLNLGYEQTVQLGSRGSLVANVGTHYESQRFLDYTHPNVPGALQQAFWKTDISLTYHAPDGRWTISAFGRNLEDAPTYSAYQGLPLRTGGVIVGAYGSATVDAPRTYGVRVGFDF